MLSVYSSAAGLLMESPPIKTDPDSEGEIGGGLRRERMEVVTPSMSRRALSYSIDNLLATTTTTMTSPPECRRVDNNIRPPAQASAASLRLNAISQQRIYNFVHPDGFYQPNL